MNVHASRCAFAAAALIAAAASAPTVLAQGAAADIPSITLKVADSFPPVGFVPEMKKIWADNITKRTDGKVKFQFFWSESLFKQTDGAPNLAAGVADISNVSSTYDPAKTALWMTLDMPFNARDYWCGISASVKTQQDEPNLRKTFDQLGFLPMTGYASGHFHFLSNKPIEKLADLQKKRIRSYGGARIKMYEPLGISPIFMPYGQIYEAVERGVVDGAEGTILLTDSFKHYEIAKFMTVTNSGMALAAPLSISLKRWNSFPDSLKKIFIEAGNEHDQLFARRMIEQEEIKVKEFQEKRGMRYIRLSPADQATLEKAGKDAQDQWLADMDKKNVPARATWAMFQNLQNACEKEIKANGYPWQKK
ncbi:MAG: TRAP transporter substrate-binding protein [Burkholderiales bacterium]